MSCQQLPASGRPEGTPYADNAWNITCPSSRAAVAPTCAGANSVCPRTDYSHNSHSIFWPT